MTIKETSAIVEGHEYRVIPGAAQGTPLFLVSSRSQEGTWHKTSATNCTCQGFKFNSKCRHQKVLRVLSLRRDREDLENQIEAMRSRLYGMDDEISELASIPDPIKQAEDEAAKAMRVQKARDII